MDFSKKVVVLEINSSIIEKILPVILKLSLRSSCRGAVEMNLTRNLEVMGSISGLDQRVKDDPVLAVSCGVGHRAARIWHCYGCGVD